MVIQSGPLISTIIPSNKEEWFFIKNNIVPRFSYNDYKRKYTVEAQATGAGGLDEKDPNSYLSYIYWVSAQCRKKESSYINWLFSQYANLTNTPAVNLLTGTEIRGFLHDGTTSYLTPIQTEEKKTVSWTVANGFIPSIIRAIGNAFPLQINNWTKDHIANYMSERPIFTTGTTYELFEEQAECIKKLREKVLDRSNYQNVLFDLTMNFGKSILITTLLKNFSCPAILLFNSQLLAFKQVADLMNAGLNFSVAVANSKGLKKYLVSQGITKSPQLGLDGEIVVAMVPSLAAWIKGGKLESTELQKFKIVIGDEIDQLATDETYAVLRNMAHLLFIGLSGTPFSSYAGAKIGQVFGLCGNTFHKVTFSEWVKKGRSLPIHWKFLGRDSHVNASDKSYKIRTEGVLHSPARIYLAYHCIKQELIKGGSVLVYCGHLHIKDIDFLFEKLLDFKSNDPEMNHYKFDVTTGEDVERISKIAELDAGKINMLVVNQIVGVGINLPDLSAIVLWTPSDNMSDLFQAPIGRVCRIDRNRKYAHATVYDFTDEGTGEFETKALIRRNLIQRPEYNLQVEDISVPVPASVPRKYAATNNLEVASPFAKWKR